jgi:ligand-binding SRPBCC domain-containing protein
VADIPANAKIFEHHSVIASTVEQVMAYHEAPEALRRLTPPPPLMFLQILRDDRTSLTKGEIEFRLWFGPIPVRWLARHELGPIPTSFVDRMIAGPMAYWAHEHVFRETAGGTELIDRIMLKHKPGVAGLLTRLIFDGVALRMLFIYRHWRTRMTLYS